MNRLAFLQQTAAAALSPGVASIPAYDIARPIAPIRADLDRIVRVTVCTRPFRAAGPRLELESVVGKTIAHNYGHGGSGWSLSWGSADVVVRKLLAVADGRKDVAVIGCGAIGLTSAIVAQRYGFRVTIYTKDRFPFVRSARATGTWSPDSRVALTSAVDADFAALWEQMARTSFAMYQSYLGSPGTPIEWTDRYSLQVLTREQRRALRSRAPDHHEFASFEDRIEDITPDWRDLRRSDGSSPFSVRVAQRTSSMTFNIADYSRQLTSEFLAAGGTIETREFARVAQIAQLPQALVINCTGYAARELWSDESIVPIRGQIAWLPPQEDANYGIYYDGLTILARRDGIAVQPNRYGDDTGWNDDNETPDRAAAEAGVRQLQELYARVRPDQTQRK